MSLLWLRFALACYFVGLVYAFVALTRTSDLFSRVALHAASLGMVFHFVSLTELFLSGQVVWASIHNGESLLAFLSMTFFMVVYTIYKTTSPGVVVFPIVFFLTFIAAVDEQPVMLTTFVSNKGWLVAHIILIFTGYAALVLSFGASLLYLVQERRLKAKKPTSLISFLPPLEVIDQIGYRSLLFGFPFMTLGLLTGCVVAVTTYGHMDFLDPKILLSVLMWAVYMLMVFTRWNSGWRGRRAAFLATFAFVAALAAWVANYFSTMHGFTAS
ncbi:MAG: cytochrome C assembly family protein [Candidatus Sulfotelmatobacter sp.]